MKINELVLFNFRSYEYIRFLFHDKFNVITGLNGQGKTSVLEAIALFALGKSVRAKQEKDLIRFGQESSQLRAIIENKDKINQLAMKITDKGKQIVINQSKKNNLTELIGQFQMILFTPDDLELIKGGPEERRKFMNQNMVQLSNDYISELRTYNRLLIQRNHLLKQRQTSTLPVWDEPLCSSGAKITFARQKFFENIEIYAQMRYQQISAGSDQLSSKYKTSLEGNTTHELAEQMSKDLKKNLSKDLEKGYTSIGPHRDDIVILINEKLAHRYASQGQIRSAVLSMKMSLMDYFFEILGEYPVLLLDDVMSELDENRQEAMLTMVNKTQTIMTTPHVLETQSAAKKTGRIFEVSHGIIKAER